MLQRAKTAFRVAVPPSLATAIGVASFLIARWSKGAPEPSDIAIGGGLVLVVFLTYGILSFTGFMAPHGTLGVPRAYAWLIVCLVVVAVFGILFYLVPQ